MFSGAHRGALWLTTQLPQKEFQEKKQTPKTQISLNGHPIECSQNNGIHIKQKPLFDYKDKRAIDSQEKN